MILSHLKSQPYDGKFRSYDLETKDFNLLLNLDVVFLGAAGLWFVSKACGKDWLRLHFLCMKTVFMSENQATHDEIILLQVSIMVHLVLELINQHGPSFLHSLLNKSLRRGNKLHGKFLALVFSDWQRQVNLRNPWSSIKSLVEVNVCNISITRVTFLCCLLPIKARLQEVSIRSSIIYFW